MAALAPARAADTIAATRLHVGDASRRPTCPRPPRTRRRRGASARSSTEPTRSSRAPLPGHDFSPGERPLTGVTTPWNTLALWRVPSLALLGFPLVGEGLHAGAAGGVEEVSAIHALAKVHPAKARALLVAVPGVAWATDFDDEKSAAWHAKKMASKEARPAAHLALLAAEAGPPTTVLHVVASP
ncbi:hypothetical protein JL720_197 [Aureococcus anophagefferens]|nr:hypothetical protein JL720_197 [Aureococcus anophagefferens]